MGAMTRHDKKMVVTFALLCGVVAPSLALFLYLPVAWRADFVPFYDRQCWPEKCWNWSSVTAFSGHILLAFGPVAGALGGFGTWVLLRARERVQSPRRLQVLRAVLGAFLGPACTVGTAFWRPGFFLSRPDEFLGSLFFMVALTVPFSVPIGVFLGWAVARLISRRPSAVAAAPGAAGV
jgi:RsiW-degrading membrane proteinase PrsW (M82 family)